MSETIKRDSDFPTTQWTLLEELRSGDAEAAHHALDILCARYQLPLYSLIRKSGLDHHDAQDVLQEFLAKLLRLDAFESVAEENGRMRSFLAKSLKRFIITWQERRRRKMGREIPEEDLPFHAEPGLRAAYASNVADRREGPDEVFDMQWCAALLGHVLTLLEEDYLSRGRSRLFESLKPVLLSGGSLRDHDTAQIAAELEMKEPAVRASLLRMLRRYRALLVEEVRHTVGSDAAVKEEIEYLLSQMRGK